ncbi:hypothetical protein B7R54_04360 [Subtercola boreus]|uniref:Acyl-CoA dehydrogenase n=2 Tax=Subtercola boreus TaxID=120213 RepID=A0A3E0VG66_9MICO|nr:hypothetical protein B7R54_04360 [Subtercola boreus]
MLLEKVRELGPLMRERAADVEKTRRLDDEVVRIIEDAGFWKMWRPRRTGGYELPLHQYAQVINEMARYCPSTAWVTALLNGGDWVTGMFPGAAQDKINAYGEGYACVVFGGTYTSEKVPGGFIVSGKWPYASGSLNSAWAGVAFNVVDDEGTVLDLGLAFIPMTELGYEYTWDVAGMLATGSNTVVADKVFVADDLVVSMGGGLAGNIASEFTDETLYWSSFGVTSTFNVAVPLVGMAQGLYDYVRAGLDRNRAIAYTRYDHAIDSPSVQLNMADAAQLIDTASLHLYQATDVVDKAAAEGRALTYLEKAKARMDLGYVARRTREAAELLLNVSGAGGFASSNPIQRQWRDLEVAGRHGATNYDIGREIYSKALLGLDEQVTSLL